MTDAAVSQVAREVLFAPQCTVSANAMVREALYTAATPRISTDSIVREVLWGAPYVRVLHWDGKRVGGS